MFVESLDRPWIDTPFLLQGFLIEDEEQLLQLREVCNWVIIDPVRSIGAEFEWRKKPAIPRPVDERAPSDTPQVLIHHRAVPKPETPATPGGPRSSGRPVTGKLESRASTALNDSLRPKPLVISAVDTDKPPRLFADADHATHPANGSPATYHDNTPESEQSWWKQLTGSFRSLLVRRMPKEKFDFDAVPEYKPPAHNERPTFIPENVQLTIYEDEKTVEEEIGSANDAFSRTNDLLHKVVDDIRSGNSLELTMVEDVIDDMVESMVRNPDALVWVARLREQDLNTYGHGLSVAVNLVAFGRHLGYPKFDLAHLGMIGLLLDIGKIRLPRELLEKTSRLTSEEFEMVKDHVEHGIDILHQTPNIHPDVLEGIAQHHERMNGTGYPNFLMGDQISVFGRMAAIADTFAAVTKRRPYAAPVSPHEALQMLSNWGGTQFHVTMVEQFIQSIGVFPVGCMVELSTGEVAVVVTHNKIKRLRPKVLIIADPDKTPRRHPSTFDLLYDVSDTPVYIRRGLPSGAFGLDPNEFYLT